MEIKQVGKKIIFTDGKDKYVTSMPARAYEVFNLWIKGNKLPKPKLK